ncbi:MAG: DUF2141 domain-containing protein [Planctomycetota bacterium]
MSRVKKRTPLNDPVQKGWFKRAWKDSRGNWLLAFAGLVFVLGLGVIWATPEPESLPPTTFDDGEKPLAVSPDSILIRITTDSNDASMPIRIAIYDSVEKFGQTELAILKDSLVPVDGFVVWEIATSVLPSEFSVAAYHDLNDDGELNRGLFNAPSEPYGFSNNARGLVGPPTFEQTLVKQPLEDSIIDLRVFL